MLLFVRLPESHFEDVLVEQTDLRHVLDESRRRRGLVHCKGRVRLGGIGKIIAAVVTLTYEFLRMSIQIETHDLVRLLVDGQVVLGGEALRAC